RLLKYPEALPRANPDGEDRCPADDGDPEIALLRHGDLSHIREDWRSRGRCRHCLRLRAQRFHQACPFVFARRISDLNDGEAARLLAAGGPSPNSVSVTAESRLPS